MMTITSTDNGACLSCHWAPCQCGRYDYMRTTRNRGRRMNTTYIIRTASAQCPPSWAWHHTRRRVAVMEVEAGTNPAMISARARGVVRIVQCWERCYVGTTARCQYEQALAEARELVADLEGQVG